MISTTIDAAALQHFQAHLHGVLLAPGDAAYDRARRVWNGRIDRYPAVIVRCADASDVIQAVQFARAQGLTVAIRGGGHSLAGHSVCDGGLVIDLSQMHGIHIDPAQGTARAEAGLTTGAFLRATQACGLATPTGLFSSVGLTGLTLGGGIGWLTGLYGMTCDNLLAAEVVTAEGHLLTTHATEHPDLFWALRGGGGNFGVVTALTFRLHPVADVLAGLVLHPVARVREILQFYRDYTRDCPDAVTVDAALVTAPDGHPVVGLMACYGRAPSEGERVLAPLRTFGPPVADLLQPMPVAAAHALTDPFSLAGRHYCFKAQALPRLSDAALETIVRYGTARPSPLSAVALRHVHGAATRVAPEATAVALREEHYLLEIIAQWIEGEAQPHLTWAENFWAAMQPYARAGVSVNFLEEASEERVRASYGDNYARLVQVKTRYDPENVFRLNQNIRPRHDEHDGQP